MICPKCSREMGNDADTCPYCGFTFLTPKGSGEIHSIPYYGGAAAAAAPRLESSGRVLIMDDEPDIDTDIGRDLPEYAYRSISYHIRPLSTLRYIGLLLLGLVPVVGYIVYIVLAAKRDGNINQKHFAAAMLILKTIGLLFILGAVIVYIVYTTPLFFYFFR